MVECAYNAPKKITPWTSLGTVGKSMAPSGLLGCNVSTLSWVSAASGAPRLLRQAPAWSDTADLAEPVVDPHLLINHHQFNHKYVVICRQLNHTRVEVTHVCSPNYTIWTQNLGSPADGPRFQRATCRPLVLLCKHKPCPTTTWPE